MCYTFFDLCSSVLSPTFFIIFTLGGPSHLVFCFFHTDTHSGVSVCHFPPPSPLPLQGSSLSHSWISAFTFCQQTPKNNDLSYRQNSLYLFLSLPTQSHSSVSFFNISIFGNTLAIYHPFFSFVVLHFLNTLFYKAQGYLPVRPPSTTHRPLSHACTHSWICRTRQSFIPNSELTLRLC